LVLLQRNQSGTLNNYIRVTELLQIDTYVNCNWVDTRWQQHSTQLHTNNT